MAIKKQSLVALLALKLRLSFSESGIVCAWR